MQTGDKILHIEGILSGTLSFIFNSLGAGKTFSEVVADAKAKGFTEPDPREDLAGTEACLLLLSRIWSEAVTYHHLSGKHTDCVNTGFVRNTYRCHTHPAHEHTCARLHLLH